jgi:nucleotide sugar dehydrogenase
MTSTDTHVSRTISGLREQRLSIGVWGCGHIGASGMYAFSQQGIRCVGFDVAPGRVQEIREGRFLSTDIVPSGRVEARTQNVKATTNWADLKGESVAVHLIAVPTERGADPSSAILEDVMPRICEVIRDTDLGDVTPIVIVESTIQPTWLDTVVIPALHAAGLQPGVDVLLGAAPRRDWFSGGQHSLESLPRIVGGASQDATDLMIELYSMVCREVVAARDAYHAAFTKVIENLIRFQALALGNTLSLAFPQYDMTHVLQLASTKWNIPLMHPSMGIGGHCIPLAPRYTLEEGGVDNPYLAPVREAVEFNDGYFARLYEARLRELLANCRSIAILGLAYTADAKMHKLSPALDAARVLRDTPRLRMHDPYYSEEDIEDIVSLPTLHFPDDLRDCDGVVLVTAHTEYKQAPVEQFLRPGTVVVDNFGTWGDRTFAEGVRYHEVGRRYVEDARPQVVFSRPTDVVTS